MCVHFTSYSQILYFEYNSQLNHRFYICVYISLVIHSYFIFVCTLHKLITDYIYSVYNSQVTHRFYICPYNFRKLHTDFICVLIFFSKTNVILKYIYIYHMFRADYCLKHFKLVLFLTLDDSSLLSRNPSV